MREYKMDPEIQDVTRAALIFPSAREDFIETMSECRYDLCGQPGCMAGLEHSRGEYAYCTRAGYHPVSASWMAAEVRACAHKQHAPHALGRR